MPRVFCRKCGSIYLDPQAPPPKPVLCWVCRSTAPPVPETVPDNTAKTDNPGPRKSRKRKA